MEYHSTLSRRDFMKALGLGEGNLRAAATARPSFLDLDEVMASPAAERKLPRWAKEVEKSTVEIDWSMMKRFDARNTMFNLQAFAKAVGEEKSDRLFKIGGFIGEGAYADKVRENQQGYTLRDLALSMGGRFYMMPSLYQTDPPFLGPQKAPTPEDLGVPRWQGTPEENTRMVRAAARLFGAATLGVVELDEKTRKLFYSHDALDGKAVEFEDVDEPAETDKKRVIPHKARWAIVYTIRMSQPAMATSPHPISQAAVGMGYSEGALVANRLQEFLRTLGYHCMAESNLLGSLANSGGFGVLAGVGELSRLNRVITPEYGPLVRVFKVVTDLPMAPTKPIDAGIFRFCHTCKKCAEACPSNCLSTETEPSWETQGFWNNPGVKTYYEYSPRCLSYWKTKGGPCSICLVVCPFSNLSQPDKLFMHKTVAATIANSPLLNGAFTRMDAAIGYRLKDPEAWWNLDLPPYGYDNSQGM